MGGSAGGPGRPGVDTARLVELEAWFIRRGVPQFVEGYATEYRVDARAAPWLLLWLVTGTVLWWGVRPGAAVAVNLAGVVLTLLSIGAGVAVVRRARGHVMWWVDRRLEAADVLALFPLVALPSAVVEQSWSSRHFGPSCRRSRRAPDAGRSRWWRARRRNRLRREPGRCLHRRWASSSGRT